MAISEAQRADLYTGLAEVLGPDRAELLMTQLPGYDVEHVATHADVVALRSDMGDLGSGMGDLRSEMGVFRDGLAAVNQRLNRLFLALVAGLFVVIAAMASVILVIA